MFGRHLAVVIVHVSLHVRLHGGKIVVGRVDDEDDELISAQAPDDIRFAKGRSQDAGKTCQGGVPSGMTEGIVDLF